jgi:hypothetical protein
MNKTYSTYLENLKGRRYDESLKGPVLSDGFHKYDYADPIKYALESMREIDPKYSYDLFTAFRKTQDLITQRLRKIDLFVDARYQGAHLTETHISLYEDLELILLLKDPKGKPAKEIQKLVTSIMAVLDEAQAYDMVDYSDKIRIRVKTRKPVANVSILPAMWVDSSLYKKNHLEINRGICEFNFSNKTKRIYLPFLNMARVNSRDRKLSGSLKSMIRLMRSLQVDAEKSIDLTYDELVGVLYNMSGKELAVPHAQYISLLPNISLHIQRIINDAEYREKLLSPSRKEYVFGKKDRIQALEGLKKELDELIEDLKGSLKAMNKTIMSPLGY